MEQINPYAVIRNTATYEAFKAYTRRAAMAGQPFFIGGFFLSILTPQLLLFGSRWLLHTSSLDWRWAVACMALPIGLGAVLMGVGVVKTLRFRREHPVPEEWRQIPRANWPQGRFRQPPLA